MKTSSIIGAAIVCFGIAGCGTKDAATKTPKPTVTDAEKAPEEKEPEPPIAGAEEQKLTEKYIKELGEVCSAIEMDKGEAQVKELIKKCKETSKKLDEFGLDKRIEKEFMEKFATQVEKVGKRLDETVTKNPKYAFVQKEL